MSTLNQLLAPGAVNLRGNAATWEEAIRLAGKLLEQADATTSEYTEAMVASVVENGPYIVVAPGFAFAHARPSQAVHRTQISWVRLETPVEFGHKTNDPVTLVVALAATDSSTHLEAMKELASLLGNPHVRTQLDAVSTEDELREVLARGGVGTPAAAEQSVATQANSGHAYAADSVESKGKIYTVCGNGLGTSLFLKNTVDQVLDAWGWSKYLTVEATDTISAKGRAKEADFLLTSGEIAATLGDVGVPVHVVEDFTSLSEVDHALRELYDV